jgi:uncharacterized membrane protein YesL
MLLFTIRKTFFDMWDNLLWILLLNSIFLIITCGGGLLFLKVHSFGFLKGLLLFTDVYLLIIFTCGSSFFLNRIIDGDSPRIQDLVSGIKRNTVSGLLLSVFIFFFSFFISYAFPFYLSMNNPLGYFLLFILSWVLFLTVYTLILYFPAAARYKTATYQTLQKSFFLFTENIGYSLFLTAVTLIIFLLSAATGYLIPGFAGILLLWNVGVKIIAHKKSHLESKPDEVNRPVPWEELLQREIDRLGKRTLRGTIFPWKN